MVTMVLIPVPTQPPHPAPTIAILITNLMDLMMGMGRGRGFCKWGLPRVVLFNAIPSLPHRCKSSLSSSLKLIFPHIRIRGLGGMVGVICPMIVITISPIIPPTPITIIIPITRTISMPIVSPGSKRTNQCLISIVLLWCRTIRILGIFCTESFKIAPSSTIAVPGLINIVNKVYTLISKSMSSWMGRRSKGGGGRGVMVGGQNKGTITQHLHHHQQQQPPNQPQPPKSTIPSPSTTPPISKWNGV